jgi:hypothetical protein
LQTRQDSQSAANTVRFSNGCAARRISRVYSSFISSARRLPNGNTLIDEGMTGRIFQVTPKGEIVWEYVNPHFAATGLRGGRTAQSNWVYRAQPVPYDWVPAGTPHSEQAVVPPSRADFHIPVAR